MSSRSMFLRRRRGLAVAVAAGILVVLSGPGASGAPGGPLETTTVTGTIENVVVDDSAAVQQSGATEVEAFLRVDGELFSLPDAVDVPPASTGLEVAVTVEAPVGVTGAQALELASDDDPATAARVLEVLPLDEPSGTRAALDAVVADSGASAHTLTVLPVYWTVPDVSVDALGTLAAQTVNYWREQSAGRLTITTSVRPWAAIPAPASCDSAALAALFNAAMDANPYLSDPTSTNHVLVYFPRFAACPFAGRATLHSGYIWDNGYTYVDVSAHEFGHNLGLGHANLWTCTSGGARVSLSGSCTKTEYGDYADIMGIAMARTSGNLNTALADSLGYADIVEVPATLSSPVSVEIFPLAQVSARRAVKVHVPTGDVFVDFRPAVGRDVRMPAWAGVQVHLRTTDGGGIPTSYLLDMSPTSSTAFASPALRAGLTWAVPDTRLVVSVSVVGTTATVVVAPTVDLERYVTQVYRDLFDRAPDPVGLRGWTTALSTGTPRIAVANAITYSDEYRSALIADAYLTYLGRAPDREGSEAWLGQMRAGSTIQQMEAGFVASAEYYAKAGSTDAQWISMLYEHVLGRGASAPEVAAWVQALRAGGSRYQVAMGFLRSTEHLSAVVGGYYTDLLGRGIDPDGRSGWVTAIQSGARVEAVIGGIIASDEYFGRS